MGNFEELFALERECLGDSWTREMLRAELENPLSVAVYEYQEGKLAAFAAGRVVVDEAELFQIGTAVEFRKRGIAERLLKQLQMEMRGRGAKVCFLEVGSRNAAAISLYEKAGYERVSVRKDYYPDDDAIVMRKTL